MPIGTRALLWIARYVERAREQFASNDGNATLFLTIHGKPIDPETLIYYAASQYVGQLHEGAPYVNLMPSIGISVLDGILFRDAPDLHLDFRLRSQNPAITL